MPICQVSHNNWRESHIQVAIPQLYSCDVLVRHNSSWTQHWTQNPCEIRAHQASLLLASPLFCYLNPTIVLLYPPPVVTYSPLMTLSRRQQVRFRPVDNYLPPAYRILYHLPRAAGFPREADNRQIRTINRRLLLMLYGCVGGSMRFLAHQYFRERTRK